MFETLEKIRRKPDGTKKIIAFSVSLFLAGLIFVVWISVLYPDWKTGFDKEKQVTNSEPSPISTFGQTFSSAISSLKGQISDMKNTISSFSSQFSSSASYYVSTSTTEATKLYNQASTTRNN